MVDLLGDLLVAVTPSSVEMLLWELVAFSASLLFFKELDREIQGTDWFKALEEDKTVVGILRLRVVRVALDFLHHWWAGLGLIIYSPWLRLQWVGAGLLLADLPDMKRRFDEVLKIIGDNLSGDYDE